MEPTFRASMNWLHTWFGICLSAVLFLIFWMGTLAVFDKEIDRWMVPQTRIAGPATPISLDAWKPQIDKITKGAPDWFVRLPTEREPYVRIGGRKGANGLNLFDPNTGEKIASPETFGASGFLYPFHYSLHLRIWNIGYWIVGFAGVVMTVLSISGIIIHRRLFVDFFTLRPRKAAGRTILDVHNISGVLGLPFNVMISVSGLIIFFSILMQPAIMAVYKGDTRHLTEDQFTRPAAEKPAPLASLDGLRDEATKIFGGEMPTAVNVQHAGDANAVVIFRHPEGERVSSGIETLYFDGVTGALLHHSHGTAIASAQRFISEMHIIRFEHWTLRWLYFVLGLAGCALILTGLLFWLESRRRTHAALGLKGVRIVEALAAGATTGVILATFAFFIANRAIPAPYTLAGLNHAALEVITFSVVWIGSFVHAGIRARAAWKDQCQGIAAFALAAVLLNWLSTGQHLIRSLQDRVLWPVAGMDVLLILSAFCAVKMVIILRDRSQAAALRDTLGEAQAAE